MSIHIDYFTFVTDSFNIFCQQHVNVTPFLSIVFTYVYALGKQWYPLMSFHNTCTISKFGDKCFSLNVINWKILIIISFQILQNFIRL
ncbi:hypothetical protein BpHYR1_003788 [Brachionus plicatilis]|uniref:Uncharacterized protein n=1 Tax=Brachionus plicatilis TaxID=10195 RepID=A0A3M7RNN0_BRAPC|nr:hypothetical protein BpHYR1_003788 [Brachionus plicatilis]